MEYRCTLELKCTVEIWCTIQYKSTNPVFQVLALDCHNPTGARLVASKVRLE